MKPTITGIVPVVIAHLMVIRYVVMETATVMKPMKPAQMIVCLQVNVLRVKYLIAMVLMNAGQNHGLVMVLKIVKTKPLAVT